jgi:tRNA(fMet)-specific endonuclease VapC
MSFLLYHDTCAAFVRNLPAVVGRFGHHRGLLHVSAVTVTGLELWLLQRRTPLRYQQVYTAMLGAVQVLSVDEGIAHQAALVGGRFLAQGRRPNPIDLLIAATALLQNLTLVTHDLQPFVGIPGLSIEDWTVP